MAVGLLVLASCAVDRQRRPHRRSVRTPRTAIPIAKLPSAVKAPLGKISFLAGEFKGGTQTLYLVNRSADDVHISTQDRRLPAVVEFKNAKGEFQAASVWQGSTCGNSYYSVPLPAGHFWRWGHAMPADGTRAKLRVRLLKSGVFMGERDVLDVTGMATEAVMGRYSPDQAVRAQHTVSKMLDWPVARLLKTMRGEDLPLLDDHYLREIQRNSRRTATYRKYLKEKAVLALPAMVRAPMVHGLLRPSDTTDALRKLCKHAPEAAMSVLADVVADHAFPRRRYILKTLPHCTLRAPILGLLKHGEDPDLDVFVARLRRRLKYKYSTDVSDALGAFADDVGMPETLRSDVRKTLTTWGRDQARLTNGYGGKGTITYTLDVRSERNVEACAPAVVRPGSTLRSVPCTRVRVWGETGWIMHTDPSDQGVTLGAGPMRLKLEAMTLPPDLPDGKYCVEATPVVHIDRVPTPKATAVVDWTPSKRGRRWRYVEEPCPFPRPPVPVDTPALRTP